MPTPEDSYSVS